MPTLSDLSWIAILLATLVSTGLGAAWYSPALFGNAWLAALAGIGFVATAMLSDSLFSGWGWRLYLIQTGYRVLYLMLIGAICGGWPS